MKDLAARSQELYQQALVKFAREQPQSVAQMRESFTHLGLSSEQEERAAVVEEFRAFAERLGCEPYELAWRWGAESEEELIDLQEWFLAQVRKNLGITK